MNTFKEKIMKIFKKKEDGKSLITHKYDEASLEDYSKMPKKPILFVRHLTKRYFGKKAPAISNISFDVFPGEFHAFIGANGAGKTTTIKSLIGAYINWSGTILIQGIKNNKEDAKKKLGYIPENARFPDKFSAQQYLEWMVMLSGLTKKEARTFAESQLKEMQMWGLRRKSPNTFSSGQKKKILLAQALIHNPDIIIMDEPVANLDPKARIEFFDKLLELKSQGKAIFVSSHVLAELDRYSDSVTVLDGGKIVYTGMKDALLKRFSQNRYLCETGNQTKTIDYLETKHIKYEHDEAKNLIIHFDSEKQIRDFQMKILKMKVRLLQFRRLQPTLDEIYKKLVIKGSVDTMGG